MWTLTKMIGHKNELHKVLTRVSVGSMCHVPSLEQLDGLYLLFPTSVGIIDKLNLPLSF